MSSDSINRVPPPNPDPLRTTAPAATPVVKREKGSGGQYQHTDTPEDETPADPEDIVELSVTENPVESENPDDPDRYWISLQAVRELIDTHRDSYPPAEFARLHDQLAFLETHDIPSLYWLPHLPLQEAITRACQMVTPAP